jgi:hypothetical protein
MVTVREVEVVRQVSLLGMTILVREAEEGGYWGEVYELPGCVSQGETLDELRRNIWEAIEAVCPYSETGHPDTTFFRPSPTWTTTRGAS